MYPGVLLQGGKRDGLIFRSDQKFFLPLCPLGEKEGSAYENPSHRLLTAQNFARRGTPEGWDPRTILRQCKQQGCWGGSEMLVKS